MLKLEFDAAKVEGGYLCLRVSNLQAARRLVLEMKQRMYDAEIKEHRRKRSLDANAYCWALIGKLSAAIGVAPNDIYRSLITDIGGNYEILPIRKDAVKTFCRNWGAGHIGWMCERLGDSKLRGYVNVMAYYGSSVYDTQQMSRLVDLVVQECRQQDIETKTDRELSLLKEDWGHAYAQADESA